jgi:hypothetical protein
MCDGKAAIRIGRTNTSALFNLWIPVYPRESAQIRGEKTLP